jgi:hypothetical protein
MNIENYTHAIIMIYPLFYISDFIIAMPTAHLKSDYCSEKLLLKYCVKITGDLVETEGTTDSKIPKHTPVMRYI